MPVCPVCNSLAAAKKDCPRCGKILLDAGLLQDFYDDYSAYLDQGIYEDGYRHYNEVYCIHLFYCPHCHFDVTLGFKRLEEDRLMD
ncbi:hypothetical protein [Pelotomaculum propionicicum]|uniref:Uncharacterized protein n=1 Tax=Pelotomaculum propionicicum TaxID=258475 RepID=A0A4Y7RSS3_9FIRM|nr:hypothetical protein [Pelotomaculum propionicicum]NLI13289.1 hypothetical protein [Peptococcaceae bacterium]TEB12074.1 hypothetical protein Pmgp_01230 [Pelotomaculum propionicicum]